MSLLDLASHVVWLKPGSALHRSQDPDEWMWGLQEMLAAQIVDSIRHSEWQSARLNPHARGVSPHPPDPLPRPGHGPRPMTHGAVALDVDEMAEWLGW